MLGKAQYWFVQKPIKVPKTIRWYLLLQGSPDISAMNLKFLIVTIVCTSLIVSSYGQAVKLLNVTLRQSNQVLTQFQERFSIMNSQIESLKQGLLILFNYDITDKDLEGQYALIYRINQLLNTLPNDAVQRVSTLEALRLVPHLKKLNSILPSNPAVFQARITQYGSVGKLLEEASRPLTEILNALSKN